VKHLALIPLLAALALLIAGSGCHRSSSGGSGSTDTDTDGGTDTDIDVDTDTDTDADTDTDTDTDTGTGTDTDTGTGECDTDVTPIDHDPEDCPINSGWPCSCDVPEDEVWFGECDDDSHCVLRRPCDIQEHWLFGVCMPFCMADDDTSCPMASFPGEPDCHLVDMSIWGCLLQCADETDCPSDQSCVPFFINSEEEIHWCFPFP
jgi:hypothetical protein